MSQEGHVAAASIFRASQIGDILRVKELISRGVGVNRTNPYGCVALHYAVKRAAESAALVARGGDGAEADQSKASSGVIAVRNRYYGNAKRRVRRRTSTKPTPIESTRA